MKTVDEVLADLKDRYGADVQAALARQQAEGGTIDFVLGWDFRSQADIDNAAKEEAMRPENMRAELDELRAKLAALEGK